MKTIIRALFGKTQFLKLYDKIVQEMENEDKLTCSGDKYKKQTVYNYRKGRLHLELYQTQKGVIYLEDINPQWGEDFTVFLQQKGKAKNTIKASISRVKAILNILYKRGISKYNGSGISASGEITTATYSTIEDIQTLVDTDFSDTPGLSRVRDIYILHCFTGMRYSDFKLFLKDPKLYIRQTGGMYFIQIVTQKTGREAVIPLGKAAMQILRKWDFNFGIPFTYQHYNLSIKKMALRAGLTEDVLFTRTTGGHRVGTRYPKWKLMSSHTARRTFATNAVLSGMPVPQIMNITGHETITAFYRYVRCMALESAISVATHKFFEIGFDTLDALEYSVCEGHDIVPSLRR